MSTQNTDRQYHRILIIIISFILIISSCTYFYFWGEANYPSIEYITSHPNEFDNKTIIVSGEIIAIQKSDTPTSNWIITIESKEIELYIIAKPSQFNINPNHGDSLNCKGVYHSDNTIEALELHISDKTHVDLIFVRSIAVVPILVVIFIISWKLNLKKFVIESRRKKNRDDLRKGDKRSQIHSTPSKKEIKNA
jgi:hypothetical protein